MPGGRPTKLTQELIDTFKQVVNENILYCTDEDIFLLLNERLPKENQISHPTFKNYKAGKVTEKNDLFEEFLSVIKKALINERRNLLHELRTTDGQWQRFAWILERKFAEWNLKHVSEVDIKGDMNINPKEWV